jgi:hypothetical protein
MATNLTSENATAPSKGTFASFFDLIHERRRRGQPGEKMVGWYDPGQLIRTGIEVAISTIFGQHADRRAVEALAIKDIDIYDYDHTELRQEKIKDDIAAAQKAAVEKKAVDADRQWMWQDVEPPSELWIDYVSDVGDGWNSTYASAYYLTQDQLKVAVPNQAEKVHPTQRGHILIFGGDEVYPTANLKEYHKRLIVPYETAFPPETPNCPRSHAYALPGNHDWYDSLSAFTKVFWEREKFAHWCAPQSRSYFALKLPHQWWLLGIDVQLGSDLDGFQLEYFRQVASKMKEGDRIILCCAEPFWMFAELYQDFKEAYSEYFETNLWRLENDILKGHKVVCYLAGDLHHYYRVQTNDGIQKITSGGGGAFLHPTHGPFTKAFRREYQASYPPPSESIKLGFKNLLFPFVNWKFGLLIAAVYWLACWSILPFLDKEKDINNYGEAFKATGTVALASPIAALWGILIIGGFWLFTDTHSKAYRFIAGLLHGLTHTFAVFLIGWGAYFITVREIGMEFQSASQWWAAAPIIWLLSYLIGPFIMGVYLLISLNVFGRHYNEAFSSLAVQDWKNFLRLKIDAEGKLTIYPIGIKRVPRWWRPAQPADRTCALKVPDRSRDKKFTAPELIERPIVLTPTSAGVNVTRL